MQNVQKTEQKNKAYTKRTGTIHKNKEKYEKNKTYSNIQIQNTQKQVHLREIPGTCPGNSKDHWDIYGTLPEMSGTCPEKIPDDGPDGRNPGCARANCTAMG